jgi:hypothetical protein
MTASKKAPKMHQSLMRRGTWEIELMFDFVGDGKIPTRPKLEQQTTTLFQTALEKFPGATLDDQPIGAAVNSSGRCRTVRQYLAGITFTQATELAAHMQAAFDVLGDISPTWQAEVFATVKVECHVPTQPPNLVIQPQVEGV